MRRTSRPATRARGSPAGSSPTAPDPARWSSFYRAVDAGQPGRSRAAEPRRVRAPRPDRAVADPPGTLAGVSERRWALATFLVATVGFVAVAAWRIPWHPVPGGTPPPVRRRHGVHPGPDRPRQRLHRPGPPPGLGVARGLAGGHARARLHAARRPPGRAAAGLVVGTGAAGRAAAGPDRAARHPAVRDHRPPPVAGVRAERRGVGSLGRRPGEGAPAVGGDLRAAAARADRLCPRVVAGLAGRGRRRCSVAW